MTLRSATTLIVVAWLLLATHPAQAQLETVLYNFTGGLDGSQPESSLTFHNGNLYGTTQTGGILGYGVVFELSFVTTEGQEVQLFGFLESLQSPRHFGSVFLNVALCL